MEKEEGVRTPKLIIDEESRRSTDSPSVPGPSGQLQVVDSAPLDLKTDDEPSVGGEPSPCSTSSFELHEEHSEHSSRTATPSTKEAEKPKPPEKEKSFDWNQYLIETESEAAPKEYFYQSPGPIKNMLKEDMKIECRDPRGPGKFCLANVEAVHGAFACIRLMGCDTSNDRWMVCDETDIRYIGYSRDIGKGDLEPPVGYMYNMGKFHAYLDSQLKIGELATKEIIHPISSEWKPKENHFKVGMKLEGVDPKNFMGTIHPATVDEVDDKMLKVAFDGWPKGYNMVVRFDSRYIFPVGWTESVGMKLEVPPKKYKKAARKSEPVKTQTKPAAVELPQQPSSTSKLETKRKRKMTMRLGVKPKLKKTEKEEKVRKPRKPKAGASPMVKLHETDLKTILAPAVVASGVYNAAKREETLFEKLAPPTYQTSRSTTPEDPPKNSATAKVDSAVLKSAVARKSLAPGRTAMVQKTDKKSPETKTSSTGTNRVTVHVKRTCSGGPLLSENQILGTSPLCFGPASSDEVFYEALQHLVDCAKPEKRDAVLSAIPRGTSTRHVTAKIEGNIRSVQLAELRTPSQAWGLLKDFLSRIGACRNLLSTSNDLTACEKCKTKAKPTTSAIPRRVRPKNPEHWSVDDVAEFISDLEETELPDLFRQSSIDGRAMFLLTPDLCMRYMKLRLGPALKVCAKIDQLKAAHTNDH